LARQTKQTYTKAGVNIDKAAQTKMTIAKYIQSTLNSETINSFGFFSGLFQFKDYKQPVLVSSVDGVGTKLKITTSLARYDTIGIDLVNHCTNDIVTCGAKPLFFLDYIAMGKLVPGQVASIVKGLAKGCRDVGCALIGGETAEMPGLYRGEDYDLVGFIVGVVERDLLINGNTIEPGDMIIGLPSSGLHTNGFSLVRKIFGETRAVLDTYFHKLGRTLGKEFLEPHRCYYHQLKPILSITKGIIHVTGGGMLDNIPRVLPEGLAAIIHSREWETPPIFQLIQQRGNVSQREMYRVFNMGIGMVLICDQEHVVEITNAIPNSSLIGEVIKQTGKTRVIIK
jgi:phosphoribosylformylglycinamidine cyclo-ligase